MSSDTAMKKETVSILSTEKGGEMWAHREGGGENEVVNFSQRMVGYIR
mgnify:FL=1